MIENREGAEIREEKGEASVVSLFSVFFLPLFCETRRKIPTSLSPTLLPHKLPPPQHVHLRPLQLLVPQAPPNSLSALSYLRMFSEMS